MPAAVVDACASMPTVSRRLGAAARRLERTRWRTPYGVLVSSNVPVDAAFLAAAPALRIVATWSVGYDNVDLAALAARGIVLTNTSGSLVETVADLTYALVIFAVRNLAVGLNWVRSGRWMQGNMPFGHDLEGATLGIVGFGAIGLRGRRSARSVSGMRVIYSNRNPRADDAATGAAYRPFDALLAEADCVVLLVPLTRRDARDVRRRAVRADEADRDAGQRRARRRRRHRRAGARAASRRRSPAPRST